jgi:hypothetical protein
MAEKRAAFSFRRRFSLGFSKCRWLRTVRKVPSRSSFFLSRRKAFSTDSPFLSLISVKTRSHPLQRLGIRRPTGPALLFSQAEEPKVGSMNVNGQNHEKTRLGLLTWPPPVVLFHKWLFIKVL